MSKLKTSPGPWGKHARAYCCVIDSKGRVVASAGSSTNNIEGDKLMKTQEANTNLIAAAPDLYVTLETVAYYNDLIKDDLRKLPKVLRVNIDNALAKARGEA